MNELDKRKINNLLDQAKSIANSNNNMMVSYLISTAELELMSFHEEIPYISDDIRKMSKKIKEELSA